MPHFSAMARMVSPSEARSSWSFMEKEYTYLRADATERIRFSTGRDGDDWLEVPMAALLKWDGDKLMLGKTQIAMVVEEQGDADPFFRYVLGPEDFVSEPYQDKDDARQDCKNHVQRLLKKAGA